MPWTAGLACLAPAALRCEQPGGLCGLPACPLHRCAHHHDPADIWRAEHPLETLLKLCALFLTSFLFLSFFLCIPG